MIRIPPRIDEAVEPATITYECTWIELAKIQRAIVKNPPGFRVSGQQDLKASVEQEAVDFIGPNATADVVGRF